MYQVGEGLLRVEVEVKVDYRRSVYGLRKVWCQDLSSEYGATGNVTYVILPTHRALCCLMHNTDNYSLPPSLGDRGS